MGSIMAKGSVPKPPKELSAMDAKLLQKGWEEGARNGARVEPLDAA